MREALAHQLGRQQVGARQVEEILEWQRLDQDHARERVRELAAWSADHDGAARAASLVEEFAGAGVGSRGSDRPEERR